MFSFLLVGPYKFQNERGEAEHRSLTFVGGTWYDSYLNLRWTMLDPLTGCTTEARLALPASPLELGYVGNLKGDPFI